MTFTPTDHAKGALVWHVVSGKICGDKRAVEQREFIIVRFSFYECTWDGKVRLALFYAEQNGATDRKLHRH